MSASVEHPYLYFIICPGLHHFKIGFWSGKEGALISRYKMYYGNSAMNVILFSCVNMKQEYAIHDELKEYKKSGELYHLQYLDVCKEHCQARLGEPVERIVPGLVVDIEKETLTCEFCSKKYKTKWNLKRHQETAIYCLQNRDGKKTKEEVLEQAVTFNCEFCSKGFTVKSVLKTHLETCSSKSVVQRLKDTIEQQRVEITEMYIKIAKLEEAAAKDKSTITDLKAQVADLISKQQAVTLTAITRPTTNVKNTIKNLQLNSLTPLLTEEMRSHIPMLTHAHIEAGAAGFAKYALEYPLKNKVLVADAARRKLKWKDPDGNIIEDLEDVELCKKFFEVHKEDSRRKISELMREVTERHNTALDADDEEEIRICDERITKLADLRRNITATIKGDMNELRTDFVHEVCVKVDTKPSG